MREKLLDLMKNEGLKPSQLAEMLEINPAGISHILAGRNKPGFDLLQKILRRFPRINPDWLILDSGTMYRDAANGNPSHPIVKNSLFDTQDSDATKRQEEISTKEIRSSFISEASTPVPMKSLSNEIERIVIFYTNRTFEVFHLKN